MPVAARQSAIKARPVCYREPLSGVLLEIKERAMRVSRPSLQDF